MVAIVSRPASSSQLPRREAIWLVIDTSVGAQAAWRCANTTGEKACKTHGY
ncbi:hypothetical protein BN132_138 [Cronobacter turicensis 564]|nr:hypothetical protein BN132_138 [Cronobacter turicensis 564]